MIEFVLSILSSIIGNLLTPVVKSKIGLKEEPPPTAEESESFDDAQLERRRQRFKQQLVVHSWTVFVFFTLLFFVGIAIGLPIAIKTGFFSHDLNCASLRLRSWCGNGDWDVGDVMLLGVLLWAACVLLVWFVAQLIADPLAGFIHLQWRRVDQVLYRRILALTIMAIAFILCGHWIYFLYPSLPYWQAVALPFGVVALAGMMSGR